MQRIIIPKSKHNGFVERYDRFLICEFRGYNQQSNLLVSIVSGSEILFRFYGVERRYNKERAASSEAASNEGIRMARQPGDGSGCKIYWTRQ